MQLGERRAVVPGLDVAAERGAEHRGRLARPARREQRARQLEVRARVPVGRRAERAPELALGVAGFSGSGARPDSAPESAGDSALVEWRPLAKDGADLPDEARAPRPARPVVTMGETYDFELVPRRPGPLRLELRLATGRLLGRAPLVAR